MTKFRSKVTEFENDYYRSKMVNFSSKNHSICKEITIFGRYNKMTIFGRKSPVLKKTLDFKNEELR